MRPQRCRVEDPRAVDDVVDATPALAAERLGRRRDKGICKSLVGYVAGPGEDLDLVTVIMRYLLCLALDARGCPGERVFVDVCQGEARATFPRESEGYGGADAWVEEVVSIW